MDRERVFSSIVVAIVGFFYILAPYEMKTAWSADFGMTPSVLVLLGILSVIVAVYHLLTKPLAPQKTVRRPRRRAKRKRRKR